MQTAETHYAAPDQPGIDVDRARVRRACAATVRLEELSLAALIMQALNDGIDLEVVRSTCCCGQPRAALATLIACRDDKFVREGRVRWAQLCSAASGAEAQARGIDENLWVGRPAGRLTITILLAEDDEKRDV